MRQTLLLILTSIFISCNSGSDTLIQFPDGGYAYPTNIELGSEKFSYYPLKDTLRSDDSFRIAYYGDYFLKALDEPNLSLKKQTQIVFRFVYEGPMEHTLVVNFTEKEIVIKQGIKGYIYPEQDDSKLTDIEKEHLNLLKWRFPLTDTIKNSRDSKYIDSLTKIYPELLDPVYYLSLLKKTELPIPNKFSYSTKRIKISKGEFSDLVALINASGYWSLPFEIKCHDMPNDAGGFSLEANTPNRYNIVTESDCGDPPSKFKIMCRKLLSYAKVDRRF